MPEHVINIDTLINEARERALKAIGIANVLIAGKTGVGKSTLINAVFQGRMAATGQGKPVTQSTTKITKDGVPVAIYDTRGLEVKNYKSIIDELMKFIETTNSDTDPLRHIHVAWLCIAEGARRFEDAEIELGEALSRQMPVIVLITTAVSDQGFEAIIKEHFRFAANVVRINSLEYTLDGGKITLPPRGLEDLIDLTMEVIPDAQKKAFAAAQRIKLSHKVDEAHKIVLAAATTAGTIAMTPIPFADAAVIVPVQIGMLAGISVVFGLNLNRDFLALLVSGTFITVAGPLGGRAILANLVKFFPAIGWVAGSALSAAVAISLTTAFGEAYIATLYALLKDAPDRKIEEVRVELSAKKLGYGYGHIYNSVVYRITDVSRFLNKANHATYPGLRFNVKLA